MAGKHHERGARLVSSSQLRRLLKKRETYDISLSGIPFAKSFEPWHALLIGAPGTGKSSLMRDFLRQIRERGDRVVIVDTNGDYLTRFWREGDVLLNPSDARGENWSPWVEISNYSDAKQLAATLSPSLQFGNDPFWDKASQSILAASLFKLRETNEMRISHLYKLLMNASIADLENFLKDTKANAFMARDAEKMAASIRATLASHIESLDLLNDCPQEKAFSVKRWIQDETQGNWLFLSCSTGQRETHLPLLSTWFDLAMRSMMDLNPSDYRRIWFFCDELPTLGKIPFLIKGLAELRKYGGCVVAGLQNISQLEGIYGRSNTSAFSSLFGSKFCFKNPDPSTAKWAEDMLGKAEENKMNESLTYGANTVRDGVSLNAQERIRPVVLDAEIMNLKMLQAYVSYPQGYPIAKHEFAFKDVPATVPVFVKAARDFPEDENFSVDHHQLDDCKYA
ncbi:MAG: type IV secretion system DNA-binding domain-containing protein [Holosporales bacterium]